MLKRVIILAVLASLLAACSSEPETVVSEVEVTREVEVVKDVEVTRLIQVETIREINQEVTRVVEIPVEVTRLMEVVVTATNEPTPVPTETPLATETPLPPVIAPLPSVRSQLLASMKQIQANIQLLANDDPGVIYCSRTTPQSVSNNYEAIINAPTYNVEGQSQLIQDGYNRYRQAIEIIRGTNADLYQFCIDWLAGTTQNNSIPYQTWGVARQGVNTALEVLNPGIVSLEN